MDAERIDDDEDDADQWGKEHVDRDRDQLFDVGAHLLQLAKRFAAALVFEHGVRQVERVADAVSVDLRPEPLGDDVDDVVLEVLGHTRDKSDANRCRQEHADAAKELPRGVVLELGGVFVD